MQKLRFKYGLMWPSWHPPVNTILNWLLAACVFLLVSIVQGWMSERDAAITEKQSAERDASKFRDLFDRCLNGGMVGRSGSVVLTCKGAEEIDLGKINLTYPVKTQ